MTRSSWLLIAAASVMAVGLGGCSASDSGASPQLLPGVQTTPAPASPRSGTARARATPVAEATCIQVAASLAAVGLAPYDMSPNPSSEDLARLRSQLDEMRKQVPQDLKETFASLESLAAAGIVSGTGLDQTKYQDDLQSVQKWLDLNCES